MDSTSFLFISLLSLPLLSFITLFSVKQPKYNAGSFAVCFISGTLLAALILFINTLTTGASVQSFSWFDLYDLKKSSFMISLKADRISAFMSVIVAFISLLVHIYSIEYMKGKRNYPKYFAYLGIFTFSMLGLVLSDNLLLTFCFWELVGFSSYLLIGFWYDKVEAVRASKKAFLFNRIGDLGFLVAPMFIWSRTGTFEIEVLRTEVVNFQQMGIWYSIAAFGLFFAAVGKSAQFPLYVWLPDAMEGPTPVSALLHAATMVAAGVYLLAKVFFLFPHDILILIAFVGALTAIVGAMPALVQTDIKKVLAYSTVSQLGLMVMGIGIGAPSASLFHLFTHAFFKAGLFLSAGAVIHLMHDVKHHLFIKGYYKEFDSQDMRVMGGFRKVSGLLFFSYVICAASLAGLPLFSGFLSKDALLLASWSWGRENALATDNLVFYMVPVTAFTTVFVTAFYMCRQLVLVFGGQFRLSSLLPEAEREFKHLHVHSKLISWPLMILAMLSFWIFFSVNPLDAEHGFFMNMLGLKSTIHPNESTHIPLLLISVLLSGSGIISAYFDTKRKIRPEEFLQTALINKERVSLSGLLKNNWYLDEVFQKLLIRPGHALAKGGVLADSKILDGIVHFVAISNVLLAHILAWVDRIIVDGFVNLMGRIARRFSQLLRNPQNGKIQTYITLSIIALIIILLIVYK